jgi:hypothetical protein
MKLPSPVLEISDGTLRGAGGVTQDVRSRAINPHVSQIGDRLRLVFREEKFV